LKRLGQAGAPTLYLYRYTTCPFCSKVKAHLDHFKIPHECVEVEPMRKKEIAVSEYKKVPQIRFGKDGPWVVDSFIITNKLASARGLAGQLEDPDVKKWREFANESLVKHLVININKTLISAWRGYDYIDQFETIPATSKLFLKVMGAPVMFLVAKFMTMPKLKKNGEIKEGDDIRVVLHKRIDHFVNEGLAVQDTKKPVPRLFHGGQKPDLADLDIYGVLQSIRGHDIYNDILRSTTVGPWLERMDAQTGKPLYVLGK